MLQCSSSWSLAELRWLDEEGTINRVKNLFYLGPSQNSRDAIEVSSLKTTCSMYFVSWYICFIPFICTLVSIPYFGSTIAPIAVI